MSNDAINPIWEDDIYAKGHQLSRYPYDAVVSFIFRHAPRDRPRQNVSILEIGCGAGNNLWFAAREGFQVAGLDGSSTAIQTAQARFAQENLQGDLRTGSFTALPWAAGSFDLAIERGALVCVSLAAQQQAVAEVQRVLRPGGLFCVNTYSDRSTSAHAGTKTADGMITGIHDGTLTGVGDLRFLSRSEVESFFAKGWEILSLTHVDSEDVTAPRIVRHSEWRLIARKSKL
jgi:2-polyprenyl-3-methyl-5-hydroxy-6-metoxy-1,4-benzoquinol methylase